MKKTTFLIYFLLSLSIFVGCSTRSVLDNTTWKKDVQINYGEINCSKINFKNIPDLKKFTVRDFINITFVDDNGNPAIIIDTIESINISMNGNINKAQIIRGHCNSKSNLAPNNNVIAILKEKTDTTNFKESYEILFMYDNDYIQYELIDIDTDGSQELLIEDWGSYSIDAGFSFKDIKIYRYQKDKFSCIFSEGLALRNSFCLEKLNYIPYIYSNSYKLIHNNQNPKLYDIIFYIQTSTPHKILEENNDSSKDCYKLSYKGVNDTIIFSFNGNKYVPNKEFYNYKTPKINSINYSNINSLDSDTLKDLIANIYMNDSKYSLVENINDLYNITTKQTNINLLINDVIINGYLIQGDIYLYSDTIGAEPKLVRTIVAILKENVDFQSNCKKYELIFIHNGSDFEYELIDIDTDGGQELLITDNNRDIFANGLIDTVTLYKFQNDKFSIVFRENLSQENTPIAYNDGKDILLNYNNHYQFVKNKHNPKLYNIVFDINVQLFYEDTFYEFETSKTLNDSINDTVIFSFDGNKYVPNQKPYNYRAPYSRLLKNSMPLQRGLSL
ncbi:MAG: hypothetical protein PHI90_05130 [Clostridia bacterium]|nr:hypothetical protein [Clostridia bacterium]MDD4048196.1 hypothetical protein [Clostridia bacterium]